LNCAIHIDLKCIEACQGCGRLVCDVCDVPYAGKHYCKECVGTLATPLKQIRVTPKSRYSRTIDRLFERWYALLLLGGGLLLIATGFIFVEATSRIATSSFSYEFVQGVSNSSSYDVQVGLSKKTLSLWIQLGAIAAVAGAFLAAKRFSLRWLLVGVLTVATFAAYPFLRIQGAPERTHEMKVSASTPLTPEALTRLRALLEPAAAMHTLPPALLNELDLTPGQGIEQVEITTGRSGRPSRWTRCTLEFSEEITPAQRATLESFYEQYMSELICKNKPAFGGHGDSLWPKYQAQWASQSHPTLDFETQH
jgi:hypothetical protein